MDDLESNKVNSEVHNDVSLEYQKRYITSLAVVSAVSLGFCLSISQGFDYPERFLRAMLPSLWSFAIALLTSGFLPFLASKKYARLRDMNFFNIKEYLAKKGEKDQQLGLMDLEAQESLFSGFASSSFKKSKFYDRLYTVVLSLASLSIMTGILWPLVLLSVRGYIS